MSDKESSKEESSQCSSESSDCDCEGFKGIEKQGEQILDKVGTLQGHVNEMKDVLQKILIASEIKETWPEDRS